MVNREVFTRLLITKDLGRVILTRAGYLLRAGKCRFCTLPFQIVPRPTLPAAINRISPHIAGDWLFAALAVPRLRCALFCNQFQIVRQPRRNRPFAKLPAAHRPRGQIENPSQSARGQMLRYKPRFKLCGGKGVFLHIRTCRRRQNPSRNTSILG